MRNILRIIFCIFLVINSITNTYAQENISPEEFIAKVCNKKWEGWVINEKGKSDTIKHKSSKGDMGWVFFKPDGIIISHDTASRTKSFSFNWIFDRSKNLYCLQHSVNGSPQVITYFTVAKVEDRLLTLNLFHNDNKNMAAQLSFKLGEPLVEEINVVSLFDFKSKVCGKKWYIWKLVDNTNPDTTVLSKFNHGFLFIKDGKFEIFNDIDKSEAKTGSWSFIQGQNEYLITGFVPNADISMSVLSVSNTTMHVKISGANRDDSYIAFKLIK